MEHSYPWIEGLQSLNCSWSYDNLDKLLANIQMSVLKQLAYFLLSVFGLGIFLLDVVNLLFLLGDPVDVLAVSFTVMRYSGLLAEVSVTG